MRPAGPNFFVPGVVASLIGSPSIAYFESAGTDLVDNLTQIIHEETHQKGGSV